MDSYLATMDEFARTLGTAVGAGSDTPKAGDAICTIGFCDEDADPLRDALGDKYLVNARYERSLALESDGRQTVRPEVSAIAPDWWDYTTLAIGPHRRRGPAARRAICRRTSPTSGLHASSSTTRSRSSICAEALEYIDAWRQSTADNPVGICGPIGPTEQLPLVARIVNALGLDVQIAHFWGMDEWFDDDTGRKCRSTHPLCFEKADRELCFNRIDKKLRMPDANLHFPKADTRRLSQERGTPASAAP